MGIKNNGGKPASVTLADLYDTHSVEASKPAGPPPIEITAADKDLVASAYADGQADARSWSLIRVPDDVRLDVAEALLVDAYAHIREASNQAGWRARKRSSGDPRVLRFRVRDRADETLAE